MAARLTSFLLVPLLLLGACLPGGGHPISEEPEEVAASTTPLLERLDAFLTGRFDSSRQSEEQPQYFAIQLLGCSVEAPELGDRVLYIEQASMSALDEPYRQRLYVLEADEEAMTASTTVYSLEDPAAAVGACSHAEPVQFAQEDVMLRGGCGVFLDWSEEEGVFEGGTQGQSCTSSLGGAAYADSEVWMDAEQIRSWDRGFDSNGAQAWGATDGPYEFLRQK